MRTIRVTTSTIACQTSKAIKNAPMYCVSKTSRNLLNITLPYGTADCAITAGVLQSKVKYLDA
jgi:hypothetical protein